jgi:hypothetical protein
MSEELKLQRAQQTFATLCNALDHHEWNYDRNDEKLAISCTARGDDLPVELTVTVDARRQIVMVLSRLPVTIPEDKRIETVLAVSKANDLMVDGSFDMDLGSGKLYFRITNSFIDSELGEELFMYLILCACHSIDEYNDRFLMLAKGMMDLGKFIELAEA